MNKRDAQEVLMHSNIILRDSKIDSKEKEISKRKIKSN